jgi:choline kinase
VILAAGVGNRIAAAHAGPKALLRFAGRSLLERHLAILQALGIDDIAIGTGYKAEDIEAELKRLGAGHVRCVRNPEFRKGSVVTLWSLREEIAKGDDVLVMDADVLYDRRILERLVASRHANCLLIDRDFVPGEEPVKICLRAGRIVEFRKKVEVAYDTVGESVGFFRFDAPTCRKLLEAARLYVEGGRAVAPHEEAIRDIVLAAPAGYGVEDVTGLAWIEIDFPDDVARAARDVITRITA